MSAAEDQARRALASAQQRLGKALWVTHLSKNMASSLEAIATKISGLMSAQNPPAHLVAGTLRQIAADAERLASEIEGAKAPGDPDTTKSAGGVSWPVDLSAWAMESEKLAKAKLAKAKADTQEQVAVLEKRVRSHPDDLASATVLKHTKRKLADLEWRELCGRK